MNFAGVDVPVSQCSSLREAKTKSVHERGVAKIVPLNAIARVHVHLSRVAKSLIATKPPRKAMPFISNAEDKRNLCRRVPCLLPLLSQGHVNPPVIPFIGLQIMQTGLCLEII